METKVEKKGHGGKGVYWASFRQPGTIWLGKSFDTEAEAQAYLDKKRENAKERMK